MILQAPEPGIVLAIPSAHEQEAKQWNVNWTYGERLSHLLGGADVRVEDVLNTPGLPIQLIFSIPASTSCISTAMGITFQSISLDRVWLSISLPDLEQQEDYTAYITSKFTA